jgi:hypothetical protein
MDPTGEDDFTFPDPSNATSGGSTPFRQSCLTRVN